MKAFWSIILIIGLISCESEINNSSNQVEKKSAIETIDDTNASHKKKLIHSFFPEVKYAKVVKYDEENNRYFLVINDDLVFDYEKIKEIICDIDSKFSIDNKTVLSFFSEHKWANYKDILFNENLEIHSKEEYQNWLNNYYLCEFNFSTKLYQTFPVSNPELKKRKSYNISDCK